MIDSAALKVSILSELKERVGKQNAISANHLFIIVTGDTLIPSRARNQTRGVRYAIRQLRKERNPIMCGKEGYWWAESDQELTEYVERQLRTAARIFKLNRDLSGACVDAMVEQLKLNIEQMEQDDANHQED